MSAVEITAIVGSVAAVATLIWAMLGNPNLAVKIRESRLHKSLPSSESKLPPKAERSVVQIPWNELETAARAFAATDPAKYDLVIGIHPDGVALANIFAVQLGTRFGTIEKTYKNSQRTPFFVFDNGTHSRSRRVSKSQLIAPTMSPKPKRVLLVDGVTTFGNALFASEQLLLTKFPGSTVDKYVFAVDQARLAAANPELFKQVRYGRAIDNYRTWLEFPWETSA
jgi:adenine/guanine phosphoribosyltransferase-like PRPP-binding protein